MKKVVFFIFFLILFFKSFQSLASDPGSSYGCLVPNEAVYTKWLKTDYAPGNPFWGPWEYYDTTGINYIVDYNQGNYPSCGYINPNTQFSEVGQTCFVQKAGGSYSQGALGQLHDLTVCSAPIDDSVYILFCFSFFAVYIVRNKSLRTLKTQTDF
ncbi:hypothetical protein [Pedobacter zeae]|uniref:Uncharacterized protein n=1 Tax=Pedobacter zeae TaxID=1737356 RepID=A0A7W6K9X4_9SPHI|nr:hypothetical protein [Pedobacter zeae]MBB4107817.1 hypothetical protein [Pedobacter zeae]GGG96837.1 hypothetical protein GCM10007422_08400 [Pedobacter zeae]